MKITEALAQKVLTTVDAGLVCGVGSPKPGQMCVEAAVCFALGLPHGDNPPCVAEAVRSFKIQLNDAQWSSPEARAKGMRRVAIAQLGSLTIDEKRFAEMVTVETIRQILPIALRAAKLEKNALECEAATDLPSATVAANTANAAAYAAYAAADAAYTANAAYAAATDAASAAYTATDAANAAAAYAAAAYTANAAYAAAYTANASANASARDRVLSLAAEIATQALIECGSEGTKFLFLTESTAHE